MNHRLWLMNFVLAHSRAEEKRMKIGLVHVEVGVDIDIAEMFEVLPAERALLPMIEAAVVGKPVTEMKVAAMVTILDKLADCLSLD